MLALAKHINPAQLSDVRLLILNDAYIFDRNFASSVSKYFSTKSHITLKPTLSFDAYLPTRGLNCYDWCMSIEASPSVDWISSLPLYADLLTKACEPKNHLDIHSAQALTQILSALINGPSEEPNEDNYVHYCLSPLLLPVFAPGRPLKTKWANSQLKNDNRNPFKPDFLFYNLSGSVKYVILTAEFNPTEQNSYIESDLVKLAKQMKTALNKLTTSDVTKPRVCGVHCEGENVHTYVMGMPSPKLYQMINGFKVKVLKNLDQRSLLPSVITHMMRLKWVASKTASTIETTVIYNHSNLKHFVPHPP